MNRTDVELNTESAAIVLAVLIDAHTPNAVWADHCAGLCAKIEEMGAKTREAVALGDEWLSFLAEDVETILSLDENDDEEEDDSDEEECE